MKVLSLDSGVISYAPNCQYLEAAWTFKTHPNGNYMLVNKADNTKALVIGASGLSVEDISSGATDASKINFVGNGEVIALKGVASGVFLSRDGTTGDAIISSSKGSAEQIIMIGMRF